MTMCDDLTKAELRFMNDKLDQLVRGQKANVVEHTEIKEILAASAERWETQFRVNKRHYDDIEKLKTNNRAWMAVTGILATIGTVIGTMLGINN